MRSQLRRCGLVLPTRWGNQLGIADFRHEFGGYMALPCTHVGDRRKSIHPSIQQRHPLNENDNTDSTIHSNDRKLTIPT